jgi:CO/xanthine dehydrogenase Mo-binding subunit
MEERIVDTDVRRLDAPEKVTGHAVYAADLNLPGMLIGRILRSSVPHARIKKIHCDRALSIPGVAAVITAGDFPDATIGLLIQDETVMARDKIRYIGEPVAAVAAVDAETAMRALALIELELDELPAVFDFAHSIDEKAPLIHEHFKAYPSRMPTNGTGNICLNPTIKKGNLEQGFAESDEIFEDTYTVPVVHHAAIEPRAVVADVDVNGRVHVWCSTQASSCPISGLPGPGSGAPLDGKESLLLNRLPPCWQ